MADDGSTRVAVGSRSERAKLPTPLVARGYRAQLLSCAGFVFRELMFPPQIFQYFSVVYRCFNIVEETKLKYESFRGCFLLCNKSYKTYGEY